MDTTYRLGELFCGPGGMAKGAISASILPQSPACIAHEWATDIDESACKTYIHNITPNNPETVICADVKTLSIDTLSPIDGFAFGFPCNDFSLVGERTGLNGKFGPLYRYGAQVIAIHKPLWFIAENVGGLQSANDGKVLKMILKELSEIADGYRLTVHKYKFEEYGVPQRRHRVIIVGVTKHLGRKFRVPIPTHYGNFVSAKDALEIPPILEQVTNNERTRQNDTVIDRLKHTKQGENAWNADLPDHLKLNVRGAHLSQIYKRLKADEPSYTITGSGGGGTHVYHWQEPRALTNRERARLQTFDDNFHFCGNKEQIRKQIGMAVPPLGAKIIFEALLRTLEGIDYQHCDSNLDYLTEAS
jgi:DNA (cytosine-5)-methyltransferase 1